MKTFKHVATATAIALVISLIFAGCNLGWFGGGSGTLSLSITDAPIAGSDVEHVYVTISKIEYGVGDETFVEFEDYVPPEEPWDMLALNNGETSLLGELELPAGEYGQLRFFVEATEQDQTAPSSPGSYVVLAGDTTEYPLFVPSGAQTGIKATPENGTFTVPSNGTVSMTADLDISKSLVRLGVLDKFILRPTFRLIVDDQAGNIEGTVTYGGESTNELVVYAYNDDTFDAGVDLVSDDSQPYFSGSETSSIVESDVDGNLVYNLAFLAADAYDVYVAEYDFTGALIDSVEADLTSEPNVEVTAGNATILDITVD